MDSKPQNIFSLFHQFPRDINTFRFAERSLVREGVKQQPESANQDECRYRISTNREGTSQNSFKATEK